MFYRPGHLQSIRRLLPQADRADTLLFGQLALQFVFVLAVFSVELVKLIPH